MDYMAFRGASNKIAIMISRLEYLHLPHPACLDELL